MASPQKEHGYTAIANELMEALAKTRIPGEPRQVLDHILRRTYGWNKKEASITHREFMLATGLKRQNISRALKRLSDINMVGIRVDASGRRFYFFIKDFDMWRGGIKADAASKVIQTGIKTDASEESELMPPMPSGASKGKGLQQPKAIFKSTINQSLCRERLLKRLKTLFPDAKIPGHVTDEQIDYFLFRVEGGLDYQRVQDPVRYIKSLIIDEEFPTLFAREEKAEEEKRQRLEKLRKEREEREAFRQENHEEMQRQIKAFVTKIAGKGMD